MGSIMGRIISFCHYSNAFYLSNHYTDTNKPKFKSGETIMAKRSRPSKRKRKSSRPESFLLGLRKKLGIKTLREVKNNALQKALAATKGDKALAAALLGIGKTTLYRSLAD